MPTYNYSCKTCGHLFEVEKTIDDETKIRCPMCKSRKVKKLINIPTVIYKDDGLRNIGKIIMNGIIFLIFAILWNLFMVMFFIILIFKEQLIKGRFYS